MGEQLHELLVGHLIDPVLALAFTLALDFTLRHGCGWAPSALLAAVHCLALLTAVHCLALLTAVHVLALLTAAPGQVRHCTLWVLFLLVIQCQVSFLCMSPVSTISAFSVSLKWLHGAYGTGLWNRYVVSQCDRAHVTA